MNVTGLSQTVDFAQLIFLTGKQVWLFACKKILPHLNNFLHVEIRNTYFFTEGENLLKSAK